MYFRITLKPPVLRREACNLHLPEKCFLRGPKGATENLEVGNKTIGIIDLGEIPISFHALVNCDIIDYFYCTFQEVIHSMIHIKLVILVHVSVLDIYLHVKNQLGTRFPSCIPKNLGRFTCQREYCSPIESILEGQLCRTLRMSLGLPRRGLRRHKLF